MAQLYSVDPDDEDALDRVRLDLRALRLERGWTMQQVAALSNRDAASISLLERGVSPSPRMSTLQLWAASLDRRIEFDLEGFWEFDHDDSQMIWLYEMSRPWGQDAHQRLWLIAALRAWRLAKGIDIDVVARPLGMQRNGAFRWEWESVDPLMGRAMTTARLLGTTIVMKLYTRDQWETELEPS